MDLQNPIRHVVTIVRHLIFPTCRIIFAIILVVLSCVEKLYTDYQIVKKEVLPVWARPPFP